MGYVIIHFSPWCTKCSSLQGLSSGIQLQLVSFDTSHFQIGTCKVTKIPGGKQGSKTHSYGIFVKSLLL